MSAEAPTIPEEYTPDKKPSSNIGSASLVGADVFVDSVGDRKIKPIRPLPPGEAGPIFLPPDNSGSAIPDLTPGSGNGPGAVIEGLNTSVPIK